MKLDPVVESAMRQLGLSLPSDGGDFADVLWTPRFHRLAIAQPGAANNEFFNVQASKLICNCPAPKKLTTKGVYIATGLAFFLEPTGTGLEQMISDEATAPARFTLGQAMLRYYSGGRIALNKNTVQVYEDHGLYNCPSGGGAHVNPAVTTTDTTVSTSAAVVNNGVPQLSNRMSFGAPIIFDTDDQCSLTVDYDAAIAFPGAVTCYLKATILGWEILNAKKS